MLEEYSSVVEPLVAHALPASPRAFAAAGVAGLEVELGTPRVSGFGVVNPKHDSGITDDPVLA